MSYEAEQARLLRLLEEVQTDEEVFDDESDAEEPDSIEERDVNTDTEQEAQSEEETEISRKKARIPSFIGRDNTTIWKKHLPPQNVRTRKSNIVLHLPGVRPTAKFAKTPLECWALFFTEDLINIIVESTNKYINSIAENFSRERSANPTD